MHAARPYDFDELGAEPAAPDAAYSQSDLEAARNEARDEAIQSAIDADASAQTRLLSTIAERLQNAAQARDRALAAHLRALTNAARDIVIEVCKGASSADQGAGALDILERYLTAAPDAAPATLFLSSKAPDDVVAKLKEAIARRDANACMSIARDDALAPSDARIEWRGGTIARTQEAAIAEIKSLFANVATPTKENRL